MIRVPFSVHEAYIEKFMEKGVDEPVLFLLHAATAKARSKTEEIAQLPSGVLGDRVYSRETNIAKLRKRITALANDAARDLDDAVARATAERNQVTTKIAAPPAPALDSAEAGYEQEIRTTLRGLTDKERQGQLGIALKCGDELLQSA